MKTRILVLALALMSVLIGTAAKPTSAAAVLERTAEKFDKAPSLDIAFVISSDQGNADGTMLAAGSRFVFSADGMHIWYDGNTQWAWSKPADEVTITEPDIDELMETNPFAILHNYATHYTCRLLKAPKGVRRVELTSKNKFAMVRKAIVTINETTDWPERIQVEFDSGAKADVAIKSLTVKKSLPASTWQYNPKKYPAASVNDLR